MKRRILTIEYESLKLGRLKNNIFFKQFYAVLVFLSVKQPGSKWTQQAVFFHINFPSSSSADSVVNGQSAHCLICFSLFLINAKLIF